jgi:hypothetical protein
MEKNMKEANVRYGVVNVVERAKYEKLFQIPFGYALTTFDEREAIIFCKKQKNPNMIVEKIFDTLDATNNKVEVFRGGENA